MFTDQEREHIRGMVMARRQKKPEPVNVTVTNPAAAMPDVSPALAEIAAAVEGVKGHAVAKAITDTQTNFIRGVQMIVTAIHAIPKPVPAVAAKPVDLGPIVDAVTANTKALNKLIAVMSAPKMLIFDEDDETKPIGIESVKAN